MTTKVRQSTVQQDNISIDWLSDVDTVTVAATNGQALVYNTGTSKWQPGSVASGSGNTSFTRTTFTATAGQTVFSAVYAVGFVTVHYNGVLLALADYTATTGSTVVLAVGALAGDIIEIIAYTGASASSNLTRTYTGTGSQTAFTVTAGITVDSVLVTENGILQVPVTDYTISSTTLTFTTAPAAAVVVQIRELNNTGTTGTVTSIVAGTGLTGGTITATGTIALATTAVTAGSYTNTNLTVDAYGRITTAATGSGGAVTSIVAGTGLTGGTITTTGTIALDATAVTAGSYTNTNLTVDAYGRITAAATGAISEKISKTINNQAAYTVTSTLATAITMPATAGYKYIVHSIYLVNIDAAFSATTTVTGNIAFSGASTVVIANKMPVPARGALELLKRPQILNPGDAINLQSLTAGVGANSVLQAIITYETVVTSLGYFGTGTVAADTTTSIYVSTGTSSVIDSIRLVNNTDAGNVTATVTWTDGSDTIQAYLTSNFVIPGNSTLELCDAAKRIPSGHKIQALCSSTNTIGVFISGRTQ